MSISSINTNAAALTQATGTASQATPKVGHHHHHHMKAASTDSADGTNPAAAEGGAPSPLEETLPPAGTAYNATGSSTTASGGSTFSALA